MNQISKPSVSTNPDSVKLDTATEIENLWKAQDSHDAVIVTYVTEAAAWCITSVFDKLIMVPKMVTSSKYGISFAIDFFESSWRTQTRLAHVYTTLAAQPVTFLHHKSMLFIGTSGSESRVMILDAVTL